MKIENGILKEVTNEDLSDGTFVMPDNEVEEIDPHAFDKCTELVDIIADEWTMMAIPFMDEWDYCPFEGYRIFPKK